MTQQDQTPRLINSSASKEVEEVVAALLEDRPVIELRKTCADLLTRLSAELAAEQETAREFEETTHQWEREADRVKAERDALKVEWERDRDEWGRQVHAELDHRLKAEADLSALKARVAEVLEPFAGFSAATEHMGGNYPKTGSLWGIETKQTGFREITIEDLSRASELHATLSGEKTK